MQPPILLLIALVSLPQLSETIYTPALPSVAKGLLATPYLVEATLAIYFLGFAVGVLLWGAMSDHFGRRKCMLAGLLIYGLCTLACANALHVCALLGWRFLQAFGASVGSVITQTILRDIADGPRRAQLFSIISGALAFSPAIGPILGGFISEYLGWRANFSFLTILSLLLISWSWRALPETRPKGTQSVSLNMIWGLGLEMFSSPALWGHILLISATNGIIFGFYQEAPFVFIEQLGFSQSQYGLFGLLIASATLIAARLSYKNFFSTELMTFIGALCICVGATLLLIAFRSSQASFFLISVLFIIFFGIGLVIPNSLSQALKPYQKMAGTAGSLFGAAYYCCIATYTWVLSMIHDGTSLPLAGCILTLGLLTLCGSWMHLFDKTAKQAL